MMKTKNFPQAKIYSFFQPLCQPASAHLQKAKAKSTPYFAKELIFSIDITLKKATLKLGTKEIYNILTLLIFVLILFIY